MRFLRIMFFFVFEFVVHKIASEVTTNVAVLILSHHEQQRCGLGK